MDWESLSSAEREVVERVAAGDSNKVIAFDLGLAESSVATRLGRASRKLAASSRVELIRAWREHTHDDPIGYVTALAQSPRLTHGEIDVAKLILSGASNGEIAAARSTSPRTVANQVASVLRKLGVRSRSELAAYYT
jgi:DNA-binding CsgD family transcriptional regulator